MRGGVCVRLMILTRSLGGSPTAALFHDSRCREHQCASCARRWPRTPRVSTKQTSSSLPPLFPHAHHITTPLRTRVAAHLVTAHPVHSCPYRSYHEISPTHRLSHHHPRKPCSPVTCHAFNLLSFLTLGTCMLQHRVSVNKNLEPRG